MRNDYVVYAKIEWESWHKNDANVIGLGQIMGGEHMDTRRFISKLRNLRAAWILPAWTIWIWWTGFVLGPEKCIASLKLVSHLSLTVWKIWCLENTTYWDSQRSGSKHCHLGDLEALPSKHNSKLLGSRANNLGTATRLAKFVAIWLWYLCQSMETWKLIGLGDLKSNPNVALKKDPRFSAQKEKSDSVPSFLTSPENWQFSFRATSLFRFRDRLPFLIQLYQSAGSELTVNITSCSLHHQTPAFIYSILCLVRY